MKHRIIQTNLAVLVAVIAFCTGAAIAEDSTGEALKNPYEGQESAAAEGGSLFNQYCSHCHGPNAVQGERPRDLRRLTIRYGDNAINTFWTTINNGRMEKGMPIWKEAISDDVKWRIYTFLQSIQTKK